MLQRIHAQLRTLHDATCTKTNELGHRKVYPTTHHALMTLHCCSRHGLTPVCCYCLRALATAASPSAAPAALERPSGKEAGAGHSSPRSPGSRGNGDGSILREPERQPLVAG